MTGMEVLGVALLAPLFFIVTVVISLLILGIIGHLYEEAGPLGIIVPVAIILGGIGGCILDNENQKRMQVEANESR